jgi:hypothetical protein
VERQYGGVPELGGDSGGVARVARQKAAAAGCAQQGRPCRGQTQVRVRA